ncbi:MAG: PIN domain-containing protein [Thermoanaerobaculia bacterium]
MLLDTSGLLPALSRKLRHHEACARTVSEFRGRLLVSPFVLAELDYLITNLSGIKAELEFLRDLERGAYELASFGAEEVARAREIIEQYSDLGIGLADASLVVLSEKHNVLDLLTLDERHFRALRGAGGRPFRILPADA